MCGVIYYYQAGEYSHTYNLLGEHMPRRIYIISIRAVGILIIKYDVPVKSGERVWKRKHARYVSRLPGGESIVCRCILLRIHMILLSSNVLPPATTCELFSDAKRILQNTLKVLGCYRKKLTCEFVKIAM